MIAGLLLLAVLQDDGTAYDGRERRISVPIPRLEAQGVVDGRIDESVWERAARLTSGR